MIIRQAHKERVANPAAFAWAGIRRFQNPDFVCELLLKLHNVPTKYHDNVLKQAQQIRYCLIQAREYFGAARAVTSATKPNLLYYGTMSLALAEILFKQSGDSSLDKARAQHRHHGLSMTYGGAAKNAPLEVSAASLRATPHEKDGQRVGTFALWHRTSREHPIAGIVTTHLASGGTTGHFSVIMGALDKPFTDIPQNGVTLADCISHLPLMRQHAAYSGLPWYFTRGKAEGNFWPGPEWRSVTELTFHPSTLNAGLFESIKVPAHFCNFIDPDEVSTGLLIALRSDWANGRVPFPLPPATMASPDEFYLLTKTPCLNEFGNFYVALFLAGNYARYYPDKWLLDAERSSALALAIEEICSLAEWRVPWLAYCELAQTLFVNES